ncbi:FAD-binding protein [Panacibacter ginsenosidivorans]|uniref:FAD-binding protein n=1 Tax=Panacibacter ginsenosidivorans TaxID=1813871 RepID=A0A5B8V4H9_9BACT|nr:FAD-dependent monooxygenase [Panacibacter ginsenosidivorans]QEC66089.1 FAD-binding protein [Panacibacter ginsenosidivorans]
MHDNEKVYDVAIIGGGLAGLTLAIQCIDAGYSTILFEKETYPYHKVCGEYISMESLPFLQRLGFPSERFELPLIKELQLSDIKGNLYNFVLPLGGFGISRYTLDDTLYQLAQSKNAEIRINTKVQDITFINDSFIITAGKEQFNARIAAGTFGKRSNIDVRWNRDFIKHKAGKLNNYIGIKYHIRYAYPKEKIALHNFENGYCGISNIENDTCCLCYLTTAKNLKNNNNSIALMEQKLLCQNPFLKEIFTSAEFLYSEPLVISQVSFNRKNQVENHVLMIGDAAGLITPLCGNGMSMAMHASKIAFENIDAMLKQKISRTVMEINYTRQWQKQFRKRLWIGRSVQRLFGNNTSTSIFLKFMYKTKWLSKKLIRATHGEPF